MVFPPNTGHGFRVTGNAPLVTYGVHSSPGRIVEIRD
jgi:mannose-6-phosphate isomerase-like protein (cupin superfamily)